MHVFPIAPSLLLASVPAALAAQEPELYRLPPAEVVALVDAPPPPAASLSPDGRWLLLRERAALPPLADVARPFLSLAGMRIDAVLPARFRTSYETGLVLREVEGETERRLELPDGARIAWTSWSHTGRRLAWTLVTDTGTELWSVTADGTAPPARVASGLSTLFRNPRWMPDGERLVVLLAAAEGEAPARPDLPVGPVVQSTSKLRSPLRTYQDLLSDAHDAALFEWIATSAIALVDPRDGSMRQIGAPGLLTDVRPAPDGKQLLITRLERPFSYSVPWSRFPRTIEVWDLAGERVHRLAELPLGMGIPIGGVQTGPRRASWRTGEQATLVWVEALDGGDPDAEVPHRDRWLSLAAPFDTEPHELLRTQQRATGLTWLRDPNRVIAGDYDRDRRWTRSQVVDLRDPGGERRTLEDRSTRDRYGNPGALVLIANARGSAIARQDGPWLYRVGEGAGDGGARPFLDRQHMGSLEPERLWQCTPGSYERVVGLVRTATERRPVFVTRYESPDEVPDYQLRDLSKGTDVVRLTEFEDPQPALRGIEKRLLTYPRADGVQLSGTLYLPPGRAEDELVPAVIWAYPREFADPATAGQVAGSPYRFTRFSGTSILFLLTQGYAVLDGAAMPVVGDVETANDSFIEQVVTSAEAAIAALANEGVVDTQRLAVGGHSYGAFMTANLLAHSNLFRAGIARSGAYNRTLTPFGFQSERRTLWEALPTYVAVSPFLHAEGLGEPLLLIHGARDDNSGTYPMQSERLFAAIEGLGGTARLVMLPAEGHGYRARESVLHVLAETIGWLDQHVKGVPPGSSEAGQGGVVPAEVDAQQ